MLTAQVKTCQSISTELGSGTSCALKQKIILRGMIRGFKLEFIDV